MKLFKNRTSKLKEAYPVTVRTEFRETSFPEKWPGPINYLKNWATPASLRFTDLT